MQSDNLHISRTTGQYGDLFLHKEEAIEWKKNVRMVS